MKLTPLVTVFALVLSGSAFAGGESGVGNGGGIWTCREGSASGPILHAELVDLSEGRREFQLNIARDGLMKIGTWIQTVESKMREASPAYFSAYQRHMALVRSEIRLIEDSVLERIGDSLHRSSPAPATCPDGVIQYEQLANFTHQGHLIVDRRLWVSPALLDVDRAALYVHEAIYSLLRETEHVTNSAKAREIVGYLFSDLPVARFAHLLVLPNSAPADASTIAASLVPAPGTFQGTSGDWAPIEMTYYNAQSGELYLSETDMDGIDHTNHHVFHCTPNRNELSCQLTATDNRHIDDVRIHRVVFSTPQTFVWMKNMSRGRVRATRYSLTR